jgi:hypothetical protein
MMEEISHIQTRGSEHLDQALRGRELDLEKGLEGT